MINNRWNAEIEADYKCTSISNKKIICLIYFWRFCVIAHCIKKLEKATVRKTGVIILLFSLASVLAPDT